MLWRVWKFELDKNASSVIQLFVGTTIIKHGSLKSVVYNLNFLNTARRRVG